MVSESIQNISKCSEDIEGKLLDEQGRKVMVRIGGCLFALVLELELHEDEIAMIINSEIINVQSLKNVSK